MGRNWNSIGPAIALALIVIFSTESQAAPYDLLVSSVSSNSILRYDGVTGAYVGRFDKFSGSNPLSAPFGLTFSADGQHVYVASLGTASILQYNANSGQFERTIANSSGGLFLPNGLAVGPDGNLYVSNFGTNSIVEYDVTKTNSVLRTITSPSLSGPTGIAFGVQDLPGGGTQNVLYVSSSANNSILSFTPTGTNARVITTTGVYGPAAIAVSPLTGNLAISNYYSSANKAQGNQVVILNPVSGQIVSTINSTPSTPLLGPAGLAYSTLDATQLLVASYDNNRIYSTVLNGIGVAGESYVLDSTFVAPGSGGLAGPIYMAYFPNPTGSPFGGGTLITSVPEPTSVALTGIGLVGVFGYAAKRRKTS